MKDNEYPYYFSLIELGKYDDIKFALEVPSEKAILRDLRFISQAITLKNEPIASLLLSLWDNLSLSPSDQKAKANLYTKSALNGLLSLVKQFNSDFDIALESNLTAFKYSIVNDDVPMTKFLLSGPLREFDARKLPIDEVGAFSSNEQIELVINHGADVNYADGRPLIGAIQKERVASILCLLELGADPYLNDNSPFKHASVLNTSQPLETLISHCNSLDREGNPFKTRKWMASEVCRAVLLSHEVGSCLQSVLNEGFKINIGNTLNIPKPSDLTR